MNFLRLKRLVQLSSCSFFLLNTLQPLWQLEHCLCNLLLVKLSTGHDPKSFISYCIMHLQSSKSTYFNPLPLTNTLYKTVCIIHCSMEELRVISRTQFLNSIDPGYDSRKLLKSTSSMS